MSSSRNERARVDAQSHKLLSILGIILILFGLAIIAEPLLLIIRQEIGYAFRTEKQKRVVPQVRQPRDFSDSSTPVNAQFGIVIPKIGANAAIIDNVDPFDEQQYQYELTRGVAHARGTVFPGDTGSMFLFAHSARNPLEASRYNAIFYLLNKLDPGDPIYIFYNNDRFTYRVTKTSVVGEDAVQYLDRRTDGKELVLMTCWPAGTTFRRLLVFAVLQ